MNERIEPIATDTIIDRVMTDYPATVPVFLRWRMQCVGCPIAPFETIADACRIYQQPLDRFLTELRTAAWSPDGARGDVHADEGPWTR